MVPLPVVVRHELVEHSDQAPFPEENQAIETLLANRAHEPFRVGVGVRRLDGRQDDAHPRTLDDRSESLRPLAIPVADEDPMIHQEPIHGVGEAPRRLGHECGMGIGRRAHDVDPPTPEIDHEERVVGHQPPRRPDFGREEVSPGDLAPVSPQKDFLWFMSSDLFLALLSQLLPRHRRQVVLLVIGDLAFPQDEDDLQPLRA
jgi:hypothetical protein